MQKILIFFLIFLTSNGYTYPLLTESYAKRTTIKFTTKLNEKLPTGYKVKINYGIDKGLVAMSCSGLTCTLSTNKFPSDVNSTFYKVGIYDSKNILQGEEINRKYTINTYFLPAPNLPLLDTAYSKISGEGKTLPDSVLLGRGSNDWNCTKDNKNGLIWEVDEVYIKNDSILNASTTFTNYSLTDYGYQNRGNRFFNSDIKVKSINATTLCGKRDWRIPTKKELMSLVSCSDKSYSSDGSCSSFQTVNRPTINKVYFPNTVEGDYWTSDGYVVSFGDSRIFSLTSKDNFYHVRLVRGIMRIQ